MSLSPIFFAADDKLLQALSEPLRKAGLTVVPYRTQAELVAACEGAQPGAVLLGAKLPDGTAVTAQQALSAKRLPCLVILGPSQAPSRAALFRAGFADVSFSPIRPRQLANRLSELLGGPRKSEPLVPAEGGARVSVSGRSVDGRLVQVARDTVVVSLPAIPPKGVAAEILVSPASAAPFNVFGTVLEAQSEQGQARVTFRLLGMTAEEESCVAALAPAATGVRPAPSLVRDQAQPPKIAGAGEEPASSTTDSPVKSASRDDTAAPSPRTAPETARQTPPASQASAIPVPQVGSAAAQPPASAAPLPSADAAASADDSAASPSAADNAPPPASALAAAVEPSSSAPAPAFGAGLFDDELPEAPVVRWPGSVPALEAAAAAARSAYEEFRRRVLKQDAAEDVAANGPHDPALAEAASAIVRQLSAAERDVLETAFSSQNPEPHDSGSPSGSEAPANSDGAPVPSADAVSGAESAGGAPGTAAVREGLGLSPEASRVVATATAHRVRLAAVALSGRAFAATRAPDAAPVSIAEDLVGSLSADAEAWSKELKAHLDRALAAGELGLLKELNATQAAVNRSVLEVRNVVRLLRGEAEETLGAAFDLSMAAESEPQAVNRPRATASVGEVRILDAGKATPRPPNRVRWAFPLLVGLAALSAVMNFVVFAPAKVREQSVSMAGLSSAGKRGKSVIVHVAPGFGTTVKPSEQELVNLVRQLGADSAQLFTEDGLPVGAVDAVSGKVTLFPVGMPGAPLPGGAPSGVVPAMSPPTPAAPPTNPSDVPPAAAPQEPPPTPSAEGTVAGPSAGATQAAPVAPDAPKSPVDPSVAAPARAAAPGAVAPAGGVAPAGSTAADPAIEAPAPTPAPSSAGGGGGTASPAPR